MTVSTHSRGTGVVRTIWFILIGWWLTALVNVVAYVIALTIIGLPLAFMIFNRLLPTVLTLRPRTVRTTHDTSDGVTYVTASTVPQRSYLGSASTSSAIRQQIPPRNPAR